MPDDRAAALVIAAIIEHSLESAIIQYFAIEQSDAMKLFTDAQDGSMWSFALKIQLGWALGIYDAFGRTELKWIRNIRNAFAHTSAPLSFQSPEIGLLCDRLKIPHLKIYGGFAGPPPKTAKEQFAASARLQFLYLTGNVGENDQTTPLRYMDSSLYRLFSRT
jgi:hypothetical protein